MRMEARSFEERSGKLSELFLFGRVKVDNPDYLKGLEKCKTKIGEERIYCELELVKQFQPFDPSNPQKKFMHDLLEYFRDNAGFKDEDEKKKVKIFTAIDSIVDVKQGTDTFIEVQDKNGYTYVRGDGTLRPEKVLEGDSKANVVFNINDLPDPHDHPEEFSGEVESIGQKFVKEYLRKRQAN